MQLSGSVEQALNTLLSSNGLFYSILDERTIVVAQDSAVNRLKYERQVAIMLPISYADATEIAQMLTAITRTTTGVTVAPVILPNKTNNTITVRATQPVIDHRELGSRTTAAREIRSTRRSSSGRRGQGTRPQFIAYRSRDFLAGRVPGTTNPPFN